MLKTNRIRFISVAIEALRESSVAFMTFGTQRCFCKLSDYYYYYYY